MEGKSELKFRDLVLLVLIGVGFFVGLSNIGIVSEKIWLVIGLFMPLIVGGVFAFVLNVPMSFFERQIDKLSRNSKSKVLKKMKTPIALMLTLIVFVLVLYLIGSVIFPNVVESVKTLVADIKAVFPQWMTALAAMDIDTSAIEQEIAQLDWDSLVDNIKSHSSAILSTAGQAAGSVVGVLSNIGFGVIFAIYILMNKANLGVQAKKVAYAFLKKSWADEACEVASLSYKIFSGFLSGQCMEAVILGALFSIVLSIANFPYGLTIGVIIGSLSLIPFIGAFIGLVLGILLIAVENVHMVLWFIIIFFIVQQVEGNLIYPRVVGGSVGLPAIWTLLAVVVGGSVSGIFGIILFIPLFSVIYSLIRRMVYDRLNKKELKVE